MSGKCSSQHKIPGLWSRGSQGGKARPMIREKGSETILVRLGKSFPLATYRCADARWTGAEEEERLPSVAGAEGDIPGQELTRPGSMKMLF